ncbi:hypothetical protein [Candidatus Nitrospira bockiana]
MRPVHPIEIHLGKPRKFLLDLKAIMTAERELARFWGLKRVSLVQLFQSREIGVAEIVMITWAGLLHDEAKLTLEQVTDLLNQTGLQVALDAIRQAFEAHMGARTQEGAQADPLATSPTASTGSPSGPSDATTSG